MDQLFTSNYSPGKKISARKYIVELVCENNANKNGIELPIKFWRFEEWETFFTVQIIQCNRLCKKYDEKAVLDVVKEKKLYSLKANWIEDEVRKKYELNKKKLKQWTRDVEKVEDVKLTKQSTGLKNKDLDLSYLD